MERCPWYAGPVGWFDASGDGQFDVALRAGMIEGRAATLYAGAGIPTLHYGPGSPRQAHGPDESVPVDEVMITAQVLARCVQRSG